MSKRARPLNSPSGRRSHKSAIEDTGLPLNYIVRDHPAKNDGKRLRSIRRVYLHQAVMRGLALNTGDVVVVTHEHADHSEDADDDIGTAFGIAWPANNLDPSNVQIHKMLQQSHLISSGDRVRLSKFTGRVKHTKELSICCIEENRPPTSEDDLWIGAIRELLPEVRYVTEGMEFECQYGQNICAFTVVAIEEDKEAYAEAVKREAGDLAEKLDMMSLSSSSKIVPVRSRSNSISDSGAESDPGLPNLYLYRDATRVTIDHRPQSSGNHIFSSPRSSPRASPRFTSAPERPMKRPDSSQKRSAAQSEKLLPLPSKDPSRSKASKFVANGSPVTAHGNGNGRQKLVEINTNEEEAILRAAAIPRVTWGSIGGLSEEIERLRDIVELPLRYYQQYIRHKTAPPRGVLLYGPPGTGKTMLMQAVATELSVPVFIIDSSVSSKYMGEAEEKLRKLWQDAEKSAPSIIFIDEADAIAPKREEDSGTAEARIVTTLLTLMDGMSSTSRVIVMAATNRVDSIDPALRRPGRFESEIEISIPDANARSQILELQLADRPHALTPAFVKNIASITHGFTGGDLNSLRRHAIAIMCKTNTKRNQRTDADSYLPEDKWELEETHMLQALLLVQPSAKREGFLEVSETKWSEIGGQQLVKKKLQMYARWSLDRPKSLERDKWNAPMGTLLYGPSGCSKTLTAKALATESGVSFIAVRGPEIFNKYVGEAEKSLRKIFSRARAASPCIIFFDEFDSLSEARGSHGEGSSDRLVNTFLAEVGGISGLANIFILAATNRPDVIDSALLRRFGMIYVGPPDLEARAEIFEISFSRLGNRPNVDIHDLALATEGCSGAEVAQVTDDAMELAYEDDPAYEVIASDFFAAALAKLKRGITPEMIEFYEAYGATHGHGS